MHVNIHLLSFKNFQKQVSQLTFKKVLSLAFEVQRGCYSIFSHQLWRKKATDDLFSPVLIIIIIIIIMEFSVAFPRGGSSSTVSRSN